MKSLDELQPGLGPRLRALRESSGLSLVAAAAEAGISRQHLWRIERELSPSPPLRLVLKLATIYNTNPATVVLAQVSRQEKTLATIWQHMNRLSEPDWAYLNDLAKRVAMDTSNLHDARSKIINGNVAL